MPTQRTVLALAELSEEQLSALEEDAKVAEYGWHRADNLRAAVVSLATKPPAVVLVDLSMEDAEALCLKVRGKRRSTDIAIFGLARKLSDQVFNEAFKWGIDDVIAAGAEGALSARLVALPADLTIAPLVRGDALVADPDPTRANLIARTLGNAGYEVKQVADQHALRQQAGGGQFRLVVASSELGLARKLIIAGREKGGLATWIVTCHPRDQQALKNSLQGIDRVGVVSVFDPVNDILYVSNELAGAPSARGRLEPRLAYGAMVAFRAAGAEQSDCGYTYNVSPHGMYVRTLAPPVDDRVWLELKPPGLQRRVCFEGEVMWRRDFGRLGTATAPPGFGVRIVAGLGADQGLWVEGFNSLMKEAHGELVPTLAGAPAQAKPAAGKAGKTPTDAAQPPSAVAMAIADVVGSASPKAAPPRATPGAATVALGSFGERETPSAPAAAVPSPSPSAPRVEARATPMDALELADAVAEIEDLENAPTRTIQAPTDLLEKKPAKAAPKVAVPFAKTALIGPPRPDESKAAKKVAAKPFVENEIDSALNELEFVEAEPEPAAQPPKAPSAKRSAKSTLAWHPGAESPARRASPPPLPDRAQRQSATGKEPSPTPAAEPPAAATPPPLPQADRESLEPISSGLLAPIPEKVVDVPRRSSAPAAARGQSAKPLLLLVLGLGGLAVVGLLIVGLGYYLYSQGIFGGLSPSPATSVAKKKVTPAQARTAPAKPRASAAAPTAKPQPSVSAAPPAKSAAEPASSAAEPAAQEGGDGSELLWSQGYLIVTSSAQASVYATGVNAGPTNQKVKVKCGLRWVRLGKDPGPVWISPGKTVDVKCQSITRVTIEPGAGP